MRDQAPTRRRKARSIPVIEAVTHSHLHTYLSGEVWLFLLFSIADVVLTFKLLNLPSNEIRFGESNPIAQFFFAHWGPKGMVYFKFILVAFVCVVAQVIAAHRVETARRLLTFAILAVAGVTVYSAFLYIRAVT